MLVPSILGDDEYPARLMDPRAVLLTCSCGKRAVLELIVPRRPLDPAKFARAVLQFPDQVCLPFLVCHPPRPSLLIIWLLEEIVSHIIKQRKA